MNFMFDGVAKTVISHSFAALTREMQFCHLNIKFNFLPLCQCNILNFLLLITMHAHLAVLDLYMHWDFAF